jgi:hypothetical protein
MEFRSAAFRKIDLTSCHGVPGALLLSTLPSPSDAVRYDTAVQLWIQNLTVDEISNMESVH